MGYEYIRSIPLRMRNLWNFWSAAITDNQIEEIIKIAEQYPVKDAQISKDSKANSDVRVSKVRWLTGNKPINDLLWSYVQEGNRESFGFEVTPYSNVQYTEYLGSEGGHYDWHVDVHWNQDLAYDRKLSLTVQLSDSSEYEGGDFEFREAQQLPKEAKKKGTVLIFPSYLQHRVAPITSGTRRSLVAWFEGPRWK